MASEEKNLKQTFPESSIATSNQGGGDDGFPPLFVDGQKAPNWVSENGKDLAETQVQEVTKRGDWRALFATPRAVTPQQQWKFTTPELVKGKKVVAVSTTNPTGVCWCDKLVVGFFVGKGYSFSVVKIAFEKHWKFKSEVTIKGFGNGAFIFDFADEDDRTQVLETGSCYISSKLFTFRSWSPLIEKSVTDIKVVPIWVCIYGIPLHLWDIEGLGLIASFLGKPLLADECTLKKNRLAYARICVEIDIDFEFPKCIPLLVDGELEFDLPVEYQWRPQKCVSCRVFGHNSKNCARLVKTRWSPKSIVISEKDLEPELQPGSEIFRENPEKETEVENQVEINYKNKENAEAEESLKDDSGCSKPPDKESVKPGAGSTPKKIDRKNCNVPQEEASKTGEARTAKQAALKRASGIAGGSYAGSKAAGHGVLGVIGAGVGAGDGAAATVATDNSEKLSSINNVVESINISARVEGTTKRVEAAVERSVGNASQRLASQLIKGTNGKEDGTIGAIERAKVGKNGLLQQVEKRDPNIGSLVPEKIINNNVLMAKTGADNYDKGNTRAATQVDSDGDWNIVRGRKQVKKISPKKNPFMMLSDFKSDSRFPINRKKEDEEFEAKNKHLSEEEKMVKKHDREMKRLYWSVDSEVDRLESSGKGTRSQQKKNMWMPDAYVEDIKKMEPIVNIGEINDMRKKLVYNVCKVKCGTCVRCSHGTYRTALHPICAREAKHKMEISGKIGYDNIELRAFCAKLFGLLDVCNRQQSVNHTYAASDVSLIVIYLLL